MAAEPMAATEPDSPWVLPEHPSPDDIDWDLIDALHNDHTLVDLAGIIAMCGGGNRTSVWMWNRARLNYQVRGYRKWPPPPQSQKVETSEEDKRRAPVPYLTHPRVLPPPDVPGGPGQDRWYKGTIYKWGMRVQRISLTGEPLPRTSGPTKGRGPVRGRRLARGRDQQ